MLVYSYVPLMVLPLLQIVLSEVNFLFPALYHIPCVCISSHLPLSACT